MKKLLENITVLPSADAFFQRENGQAHTSYLIETTFYSLISEGEAEKTIKSFDSILSSGITIGKLSVNPLRQLQYWAVCCITLGVRYAIQGGLDEITAYNLSDEFIMKIDNTNSKEEIIIYLKRLVEMLCNLVKQSARLNCPAAVKKCINYISEHTHEKIKTEELSKLTGYSRDYISKLFKRYIGFSVHTFVLTKKLEEAKSMLFNNIDQSLIAYTLGFCSQTHFITCFKKAYGITPMQMMLK